MVLLVNNRCEIIGDLPCKRDRYQNISISEASFKDGLRNERFYTEKATVWKYRGTMKSLICSLTFGARGKPKYFGKMFIGSFT